MNKILLKAAIFLGVLLGIYMVLGATRILGVHSSASLSNEPGLEQGTRFLASNLIEPINGKFVCYKIYDPEFPDNLRVHRLIASENDTLEIVDGEVFVNQQSADKELVLYHAYKISNEAFDKIKNTDGFFNNPDFIWNVAQDVKFLFIKNQFAKKNNLDSNRIISPKGEVDSYIKEVYNQDWNKDNFGPLIIPENKVFVMGDNRDNSRDSRYVGLVERSGIVGVVIKK